MILDQTLKLEAVLAGAVSANQPEVHVGYIRHTSNGYEAKPAPFRVALNSNTDVTILAAPPTGDTIEPETILIYNKDTAAVTVTVKSDNGTTEFIYCKVTLQTTETLAYEKGNGWYVMQASGAIKQGAGVTSSSASTTDNAVARFDGTSGTLIQNSAFVVDDSGQVSSFGGNIKFPASQSASADANTLDDYEEGTWTPVLTFATPGDLNVVYSTQVGSYTKVGNLCTVSFNITTSTFTFTTAANGCRISGLPFTILNVTGSNHNGALVFSGITKATYTNIVSIFAPNLTRATLTASGSGVASAGVNAADMPSAGTVILSSTCTFQTA